VKFQPYRRRARRTSREWRTARYFLLPLRLLLLLPLVEWWRSSSSLGGFGKTRRCRPRCRRSPVVRRRRLRRRRHHVALLHLFLLLRRHRSSPQGRRLPAAARPGVNMAGVARRPSDRPQILTHQSFPRRRPRAAAAGAIGHPRAYLSGEGGGVDAVDAVEWAAAMSCSRAFKTHAHPRLVCLKPNSTTKKRTREFKRRRICTCDALRLFPRALAYRGVSRRFDPVEGVHAPAPFFVAPARERTVFCVLGEVEVPSFLSRATS
jgi:hypothetical protein